MIAPIDDYGHEENAAIAKQLADAGVPVHTGGHGQREGLATHWELWTMVEGGMSPIEALAAATRVPAESLGMGADLGTIEPGKLADLVIVDGQPDRNIRDSDKINAVIQNGRVFNPLTLNEKITGQRTPTPLYWQGKPESAIR